MHLDNQEAGDEAVVDIGAELTCICVHAAGGGTVSSTILALSNADPGENVLLYADGQPCSTPYRDYREAIRRLPSPG